MSKKRVKNNNFSQNITLKNTLEVDPELINTKGVLPVSSRKVVVAAMGVGLVLSSPNNIAMSYSPQTPHFSVVNDRSSTGRYEYFGERTMNGYDANMTYEEGEFNLMSITVSKDTFEQFEKRFEDQSKATAESLKKIENLANDNKKTLERISAEFVTVSKVSEMIETDANKVIVEKYEKIKSGIYGAVSAIVVVVIGAAIVYFLGLN